jgi:pimeloyl-ACP methyl ester carboxylesterase
MPANGARATVLIHHGALVNKSSHLAHYRLLHELGYNVFIYDYQGFGESFVLASLDTILDDADAALTHVQSRTDPGTEKIVLFGLSMGTMPALAQCAESPERVVGLVLEGSFVQSELPPFAYVFLGIQPSPLAFERIPPELDSVLHAPLVTMPKYFMHSRQDLTTPISSSQHLFELAAEPREFIELIGGHIDAVNVDPAYRTHLERILLELTAD